MLVKCSLCGGQSEVDPGEKLLVCSFCGATLAVEKPSGPEHLILVHKRDDAAAEETLRSFLIEKERRSASSMTTDFSFVPFSLVEDAEGDTSVVPAARAAATSGGVPYPPAGDYRFFDESCGQGEKIVPVEKAEEGTTTIVHLPIYTIRYEAADWRGKAAVVGESWQVIAEAMPPERPRAVNAAILLGGVALFVGYLVLGKLAPNFVARLILISLASSGGFLLYSLHQRFSKLQ